MILQQFGIDVSEAHLVFEAVTNGWLTDAGTSIADLGQLLDAIAQYVRRSGETPWLNARLPKITSMADYCVPAQLVTPLLAKWSILLLG